MDNVDGFCTWTARKACEEMTPDVNGLRWNDLRAGAGYTGCICRCGVSRCAHVHDAHMPANCIECSVQMAARGNPHAALVSNMERFIRGDNCS